MEGRVIPYLEEVRLAGNLPGRLQGTYVHCCAFTCIRVILEWTPRVECTQVTSLFRLVTSNFTLCGQLRCHQVLVHSQARNKLFTVRVVHVQWRMRDFLKFKSSCTVRKCTCRKYITRQPCSNTVSRLPKDIRIATSRAPRHYKNERTC